MKFGIIGSYSFIKDTLRQNIFLNKSSIDIYITDNFAQTELKLFDNRMDFSKLVLQNNLLEFLKNNNVLIVDSSEKYVVLLLLRNNWTRLHRKGAIILRNNLTVGYTNKLKNKLDKLNRNIEVINYLTIQKNNLQIPGENNNMKLLILGGNTDNHFITKLRTNISSINVPVFLIPANEAEAIEHSIHTYEILKKAFLVQLENYYEKNELDIEILKKAFSSYIDLSMPQFTLYSNKQFDLKENNLLSLANKIIKKDRSWPIEQIKFLNSYIKQPIKQITIWGVPSSAFLNKLNKLQIKRINIFSFRSLKLKTNSPKFNLVNEKYLSVDNSDVLIMNDYHDEFASVSLNKIERKMRRKIIIDAANLFEIQEMKALNWIYLSKGRKKLV